MNTLQSINVRGLHRRFDLDLKFFPDTTVIFGKNGASKTTTLHIITNIMAGDIERFAYLEFSDITVTLSDETVIELKSHSTLGDHLPDRWVEVYVNGKQAVESFSSRTIRRELTRASQIGYDETAELLRRVRDQAELIPKINPTYFPAFRSALEGMEISREEDWGIASRLDRRNSRNSVAHYSTPMQRRHRERQSGLTHVAREAFGPFVPAISYASTRLIISELRDRIREATLEIAELDRSMLSNAFARVFDAIGTEGEAKSGSADQLLEEIRGLLLDLEGELNQRPITDSSFYQRLSRSVRRLDGREVGESLKPMLRVYRDSLRDRIDAQERAFREITLYLDTVNGFLEGKQLSYSNDLRPPSPGVRQSAVPRFSPHLVMPDGSTVSPMSLSSGERQILSLLYATVFQSDHQQQLVLIDEPEISLHIDWQRMLIKTVADQLKSSQLVVFTHSPEIASMFSDRLVEISPSVSSHELGRSLPDEELDMVEDDLNDVPF